MTIIHLITSKIKSTFSSPVYRSAFTNGFLFGVLLGLYIAVLTQTVFISNMGAN